MSSAQLLVADKTIGVPSDPAELIAERLVEEGKLDRRGIERAQRLVADSRESLLHVLAKLGLVAERDLAEAIAAVLELPLINAKDYPERPLLEDRLSLRFLREARLVPIADTPDGLVVAMTMLTGSTEVTRGGARIVFYGDGTSTGGRVRLLAKEKHDCRQPGGGDRR